MSLIIDTGIRFRNYFALFLALNFLAVLEIVLWYKIPLLLALGIAVIVLNFLVYMVIQPRYFFITFKNDKLFFKTNWETDDQVIISKKEFGGFKIKTSFMKYKKMLVLFKKTPQGLMGTKALSIGLLKDAQLLQLISQLNQLKKE
ncbi:MAG: hypothetical protein JKX95_07125 [Bacteroidia bacterium]|nr:hypothetical protein [Bacteroidia bacterium]